MECLHNAVNESRAEEAHFLAKSVSFKCKLFLALLPSAAAAAGIECSHCAGYDTDGCSDVDDVDPVKRLPREKKRFFLKKSK